MDTVLLAYQLGGHHNINSSHIILVIFGALLYNLMEVDRLIKSSIKFSFNNWIYRNWIAVIITVVSLASMFMLRDDLKQLMGFDMTNRIGCFLAGFTVHSFTSKLNSFVKIVEEKKNNNNTILQ
jgi:hypothetical protein